MGETRETSYQNLGLRKVHNANLDATVLQLKKMMILERLLEKSVTMEMNNMHIMLHFSTMMMW